MALQQVGLELVVQASGDAQTVFSGLEEAVKGLSQEISQISTMMEQTLKPALEGVSSATKGIADSLSGLKTQADTAAGAMRMEGVPAGIDAVAQAEKGVKDALTAVVDQAAKANGELRVEEDLLKQIGSIANEVHGAPPGAMSGVMPGGTGEGGASPGAPKENGGINRHGAQQQATDMLVAGLMVQQAGQSITDSYRSAIDAGAQYQKLLNDVATNTGMSAEETQKWAQQLLGMSQELPKSPEELAKALYLVVSAGYSGSDALNVLHTSAQAATAGISDTTTAADALTTVLNAYGMNAKDAARVSDIMFRAVADGKMHFQDLASNLGQVVPTAAAAKVPFYEIAAAFATMTNSGVPAAEASTAINRALVAFLKPSKQAQDEAKKLGLNLSETELQSKGLAGAMDDLMRVTGGDPAKIEKLVGDIRGMKAALDLTNNGGEAYKRVLADMQNSSGATAASLDIQNRSYANQEQIVRNTFAAMQDSVFQAALPALEALASVVKSLMDAFNNLPGPVKEFLTIFGGTVGIFLLVGGHIMTFVGSLAMVALAFGAVGTAAGGAGVGILAATWPILAIIAAVAVLAAGIYLLIKHWSEVKQFLENVWAGIKTVAETVWNAIAGFFVELWNGIKNGVSAAWNSITNGISSAWEAIKSGVSNGVQAVASFFVQTIPHWIEAFVGWYVDTEKAILGWFAALPGRLVQGIGFVAGWLSVEIPKAWTAIIDWLKDMGTAYAAFWVELPGKIWNGLKAVGTWLGQEIPKTWTAIKDWLVRTVLDYITFWAELPGKILSGIQSVGAWLGTQISMAWTAITDWVASTGTALLNWFTSLPGKFTAWIGEIGTAIANAAQQFASWGVTMAENLWNAFTSFFTQALPNWISSTVSSAVSSIKGAVSGLLGNLTSGFHKGQEAAQVDNGGDQSIPSHASGGFFDIPHLAWVGDAPGGEFVVNRTNAAQMLPGIAAWVGARPASGGGQQIINITVNANGNVTRSERGLADMVVGQMWQQLKRRSPSPLFEVG